MLRRAGLSIAAIAAILAAAVLLFGSPSPSPTGTPVATARPPTAVDTPSTAPSGPYIVASGGEVQGAQLVTATFGWVRTGDGYRVTEDGGLTWRSAAWPDVSDQPVFTDASDGWVFGQVGGLYRTSDGGASWTSIALPPAQYQDVGSPAFGDPRHGTLVAQEFPATGAVVLSTADGGAAWSQRPIAWPGLGDVGAVRMFDAQRGLVLMASRLTATGPTFDQTSDGGRTWHALVLPRPSAVPAVDVASGQLWAGPPVRIVSATTAVTWQVYEDPSGATPGWIAFFATADAGRTWRQAGPIVPDGTVAVLSARHWLLVSPTGLLAQTTDGGTTWSTAATAGLALPVRWLDFPTDDGHGWAGVGRASVMCAGPDGCGPDGLEATSDGGLTWRSLGP